MGYQPQSVIVGAGIVGLSTAYALLERGMQHVLVLEQAAVNHPRATSASISRLLRFAYGADSFYSHMVQLSLAQWQTLEKRTRRQLYTPTGLLSLGKTGEATWREYEIACELGLAGELLTSRSCQQRFPQFEIEDYTTLAYTSAGGILHASTCLNTLKRAILDMGGEIAETCEVSRLEYESARRPIRLYLSTGERLHAERTIIATGPWVHRLLGQLRLPVTITRQYILYFAGLAPTRFGIGTFPAFVEHDLYGFPIHQGSHGWLKVASHAFGRSTDPDARAPLESQVIERTVRSARRLLPALHNLRPTYIEDCVYDVTPDEDFILDYLPEDERVVFATGLSGHGFKFGPLLGQLLSSMVCATTPAVPLTRFRLARFTPQPARQPVSVA